MIKLSDLFKYYKHGTPHQMAAISELEAELLKVAPEVFNKLYCCFYCRFIM